MCRQQWQTSTASTTGEDQSRALGAGQRAHGAVCKDTQPPPPHRSMRRSLSPDAGRTIAPEWQQSCAAPNCHALIFRPSFLFLPVPNPPPPPSPQNLVSANVMTAAVYGRHTLDELQALVVDAFSPVVDQQLPVPSFSPDVFTDEVRRGGCGGDTASPCVCLPHTKHMHTMPIVCGHPLP